METYKTRTPSYTVRHQPDLGRYYDSTLNSLPFLDTKFMHTGKNQIPWSISQDSHLGAHSAWSIDTMRYLLGIAPTPTKHQTSFACNHKNYSVHFLLVECYAYLTITYLNKNKRE